MNCPAESNRKTCLLILPLNVCRRFRKQKMNRYGSWCFLPVWVQLRLVISLGSLWDCLAAFVCGVILQLFFSFLDEKQVNISKVLLDIIGGLLVTVICVVLNRIGVSEHLDLAITGAIIPMIPGVAFTNGIRDIVDGDYLSGCVRLLDAILVFCSIAIGVGLGLKL